MTRLVVSSKGETRTVDTAEGVVTIGRGAETTVHILDEAASRRHCRIEQAPDGSWRLTDLGSRNGTRLNGEQVREKAVKAGDVILIGATTIALEALGDQWAPAGAQAPGLGAAAQPTAPQPAAPEAGPAFRLVMLAGPNKGETHAVVKQVTGIGRRRRDNEIALFDKGISNRHAEIRREPSGLILVDIGSKNGTFLNGHRVTQSPLKPGDRIAIGRSIIEVQAADASAAPTAPVPTPTDLKLLPPEGAAAQPPGEAAAVAPPTEAAPAPTPTPVPGPRRLRAVAIILSVVASLLVPAIAGYFIVKAMRQKPTEALSAPQTPGEQPGTKAPTEKGTGGGDVRPASAAPGKGSAMSAGLKAALAEAGALAAQKRYAEALRRLDDFAKAGGTGLAESQKAQERAAQLDAQAKGELGAALDALRRAELTGEAADFAAARKALDAAANPLKGTAHERDLAKAVERFQSASAQAATSGRDAAAAELLAAAKLHSDRKEPHVAALHCRELLARFPDSPAAAEAKALLKTLNATSPIPKEK